MVRQDDQWLGDLLGEQQARSTPFAKDHHGVSDEEAFTFRGAVGRIEVLTHDLQPVDGQRNTLGAN